MTTALWHQSARSAVSDSSGVGEARRLAASWARGVGLDDTRTGAVALIVTELASNIVQHAREGEIVLRRLHEGAATGLEVLALDRGPGMRNVAQCMVDGYSTAGTAGHGLGSVERAASVFDLYSLPGKGSALLAQIWSDEQASPAGRGALGAVCLPVAGEEVSGDGFGVGGDATRRSLLVLDGLGHGQGAADAALAGLTTFRANDSLAPAEQLARMHDSLRATRGAAAALALVQPRAGTLQFAGVGNCCGSIHDRRSDQRPQSLTSHNGIVGANLLRVHEFNHVWPADGLLVLHSDGLSARWNLADYPGLVRKHPSLVAGVLYRDFSRSRDDVTVLAFAPGSA
jgi:anti-sigma regulatory factor (Ser/Thr protein kinase)